MACSSSDSAFHRTLNLWGRTASSGFVLNHLAGKAGMTPECIDSLYALPETPWQPSRVVAAFAFHTVLTNLGGLHEIASTLSAQFSWWNEKHNLSYCVSGSSSAANLPRRPPRSSPQRHQ